MHRVKKKGARKVTVQSRVGTDRKVFKRESTLHGRVTKKGVRAISAWAVSLKNLAEGRGWVSAQTG